MTSEKRLFIVEKRLIYETSYWIDWVGEETKFFKEVVEFPSLVTFKLQLVTTLSNIG